MLKSPFQNSAQTGGESLFGALVAAMGNWEENEKAVGKIFTQKTKT